MYLTKNWPTILTDRGVRQKVFFGMTVLAPVPALLILQTLTGAPTVLHGGVVWRSAVEKVTTFPWAFILSYDFKADVVVIVLWLAAATAMVRIELWRHTRFDWLHLSTFIFFILYIVLPRGFGSAFNVDRRALTPLLICSIALIARFPPRRVVAGAALALLAMLLRLAAISVSWQAFGEVQAEHLNFIRQLPIGARILGASVDETFWHNDAHVVAWAVPEREAMVSSLAAFADQQPLRVSVAKYEPFIRLSHDALEFDVARVRAGSFDYVWLYNPRGRDVTVPKNWTPVYSAHSTTVWKIN
jgi:hypothetical protein